MNKLKHIKLFENFDKKDSESTKDIYTITYENPTFITPLSDYESDDYDDYESDSYNFDNIIEILIDDFNTSKLEQYVDDDLKNIISIRAEEGNKKETFLIKVKIKGEPTKDDIYNIEDYLSGQCSDGWGEGFEQQDINGCSVSTWHINGPHLKWIKIEKED